MNYEISEFIFYIPNHVINIIKILLFTILNSCCSNTILRITQQLFWVTNSFQNINCMLKIKWRIIYWCFKNPQVYFVKSLLVAICLIDGCFVWNIICELPIGWTSRPSLQKKWIFQNVNQMNVICSDILLINFFFLRKEGRIVSAGQWWRP